MQGSVKANLLSRSYFSRSDLRTKMFFRFRLTNKNKLSDEIDQKSSYNTDVGTIDRVKLI